MINPDRLTVKSAEALNEAVALARKAGNPLVYDLHLLLALLTQDEGIVVPVLQRVGANVASVRAAAEAAGLTTIGLLAPRPNRKPPVTPSKATRSRPSVANSRKLSMPLKRKPRLSATNTSPPSTSCWPSPTPRAPIARVS